jgi:hypothetical protein
MSLEAMTERVNGMDHGTRRVWFRLTIYEPRLGGLVLAALNLAAALLLFSRCPSRLLHPELWAEDGVVWLQQAYDLGVSSLMIPVAGYLQTLSRLGGLLAIQWQLTQAPLIFTLIAFLVQLAPVALLLSKRGEGLVPSLSARLLIVLYYIGIPNSSEVYVNLTNAMWHLALVAFLMVVLPKPKTVAGMVLDVIALVLAGLSGPLVLFIAPIAWWVLIEKRASPDGKTRLLYAGLLTLCALVQGVVMATNLAENRLSNLGANFSRLVHILANQIFLGGIIGAKNVFPLLANSFWLQSWPAALCCLVALVFCGIAFVRGHAAYRQFLVLAVLIMASALKTPMVSADVPQWVPMQTPGAGDRYYVIPMLAWFVTLLVVAGGRRRFGLQWVARGALLCCVVGVAADWRYEPYAQTGYQGVAEAFDRAPAGAGMIFPENPGGWQFRLTKH